MKIAVLTAHKGSISWTRMIDNIRNTDKIYIEEIFAFNDNEYRSNFTKFSKFIIRFKTFIYFPFLILWKANYINNNFDTIIVITSPFFLPYITVKYINKPKSIILYNDIYPEALISKNLITINSLLYNYFLLLQKRTYIKSNYSVFICKEHYDFAKSNYFFPNTSNFEIINVPAHLLSNSLDSFISKTITFNYSGTIGIFHDFSLFSIFLKNIKSNFNFKFILNTSGYNKKKFETFINSEHLNLIQSNSISLGNPTSSNEYEILMKSSQIGLIFQDTNNSNVIFPSKFASMLISGQAILAFMNIDCNMANIILENDLGWVIDSDDVDNIHCVLKDILNMQILEKKRKNALQYGNDNYSIVSVSSKWKKILT